MCLSERCDDGNVIIGKGYCVGLQGFPKTLRQAKKISTKSGLSTIGLPIPLCLLFLDRLYYIRCGKNTSLHVQLAEAPAPHLCLGARPFWGVPNLKLITPHDRLGIDRSVDRIDRSGCQVGGSNI